MLGLLLVLTLVKGLVTTLLVPVWEFPDEQAHFAQVSYYVESGLDHRGNDLSRELYELEKVMGTVRDERGINNYTYNPNFRPAYSDTLDGPYEQYIESLPDSYRTEYVKREAARYQPGFYLISSLGYRITYNQSLINRIYATRFISVGLSLLMVGLAYLLGWELSRNKGWSLLLATLISFQPMISFLFAGVNNDNLLNVCGLALLWITLYLWNHGWRWWLVCGFGLVSLVGVMTKPLIYPVLLAVSLVVMIEWWYRKRSWREQLTYLGPLLFMGLLAIWFIFIRTWLREGAFPFISTFDSGVGPQIGLIDYLKMQLAKYYRETLVWYWGVFKWLGVVLPLNLIRLLKLIMVIAAVGLVKFSIQKTSDFRRGHLMILILFSVVYVAALTLWDFDVFRKRGFSHGIQGRYFFPTIGAHLGLLLIGWSNLVGRRWRLKWSSLLAGIMIGAHLVSWWTIARSYYSLDSVGVFFVQLSQYKPDYFKYPYSLIWLGVYILILSLYLIRMLQLITREKRP